MSDSAADGALPGPRTPREAVAAMRIHAPTERNPRLGRFLEAVNASMPLKARWHVAQVNAERLEMSDHSWVHLQIVLNRALHLFRLLHRHGLKSSIETRLRALAQGRRGGDRRRLPAARPRDVDPPRRPRGLQPAPRRRPARRPARERLRRARADGDRGRDPARDHRPPQGRAPADARGRRRARRRRAGHGARPLARRRSRPAWPTSTRSRRRRSTRSRSSPASSARCASRC